MMKRIIITLIGTMAIFFAANAQQFTNGGFEAWTGSKPDGWKGLEISVPLFGSLEVAPGSIASSNESHGGSFALKLQPKGINSMLGAVIGQFVDENTAAMLNNMKIPAFITNGTIDIMGLMGLIADGFEDLDITQLANSITNGLPISEMPQSIEGFLNFTKEDVYDEFIIAGLCFAEIDGVRTLVGVANYFSDMTTGPGYSGFVAPMAPISDATPNELILIAVSLPGSETSEPTLLLDDLFIRYEGAGLTNVSVSANEVYPNPSTGIFTVNCKSGSSIAVLNMLGQEVFSVENYKGTPINIDKKGMYFVKIGNGKDQITKKVIVK